jgi:molecular chaperone GrpE
LPPQEQKTPAEITQLENELDQAKLLAEKNRNDYLRVLAEMENLRRRLERDLEQAHKYALEKMVRELLPVVDSLEKSLEHANDETLKQGVEMTLNLLLTTLRKFQVTEINPIGQVFNPAHHEAMSAVPSAEHAPNIVIQVLQKGFMLHDRLVRPALVVVSKADK